MDSKTKSSHVLFLRSYRELCGVCVRVCVRIWCVLFVVVCVCVLFVCVVGVCVLCVCVFVFVCVSVYTSVVLYLCVGVVCLGCVCGCSCVWLEHTLGGVCMAKTYKYHKQTTTVTKKELCV